MADMMSYVILALIPLALVVGYFVYMGRKKDEERALMEVKWIQLSIRFVTTYDRLVRTKELLGKYADELGWVMTEGKAEESGVTISIMPEKSWVNPTDFLANQKKYRGVSYSILRDVVFGGNDEEVKKSLRTTRWVEVMGVKEGVAPGRANFYFKHQTGILTIAYPLANRLKLEGRNIALATEIFGGPAMSDLKGIFGKESVEATLRSVRADGQRRISDISSRMTASQDKADIEKADKAIQEIGTKTEAVAAQVKQGRLKIKDEIEKAFDISIE